MTYPRELTEEELQQWKAGTNTVVAVTIITPHTIYDQYRLIKSVYSDIKKCLDKDFIPNYLSRPPQLGAGPSLSALMTFLMDHREVILFWLGKLGVIYKIIRGAYRLLSRMNEVIKRRMDAKRQRQWAQQRENMLIRLRLENDNYENEGSWAVDLAIKAIQDLLVAMPALQQKLMREYPNFNTHCAISVALFKGGIVINLPERSLDGKTIHKIVSKLTKLGLGSRPTIVLGVKRWGPLTRIVELGNGLRVIF